MGAVVAGNALSVASAVELTRGIVDDHNRLRPESPINFYSTVRLFSFFLNRIEQQSPWSEGCEVALSGFLSNGVPALAKVCTGPSRRAEVHVYAHQAAGSLFLFVGQREGKEQIFSAVGRALEFGAGDWIQRAVGTIAYLCEHEGERTIGGAPAVAFCAREGVLQWPLVVMNERTYLRGFDISAMSPATEPYPGDERLHVHYEQSWHARVDQNRPRVPVRRDQGCASVSWFVDAWVPPEDAFNWKVEPEAFKKFPDLASAPHIVGIMRPGEVSSTRQEEEALSDALGAAQQGVAADGLVGRCAPSGARS